MFDDTLVPRSAGAWNVLDDAGNATGIIATKTADTRRWMEDVLDPVTKDVIGEQEMTDESTKGVYTFDNLPAAYTSEDGSHYLASYRVEVGELNYTSTDETTLADDEAWLLTRFHKPAGPGGGGRPLAGTKLDSDADSDVETVLDGIAVTAQDSVVTLDGATHDGTPAPTPATSSWPSARQHQVQQYRQDHDGHRPAGLQGDHPVSDVVEKTIEGTGTPEGDLSSRRTATSPTTGSPTRPRRSCARLKIPTPARLPRSWWRSPIPSPASRSRKCPGGDAGEIQPPTQKITGVVFNDADNDGMNGTLAVGEGDATVDHPGWRASS